MNSKSNSEYLNVRETARLLQVHENTIRNWADKGVLKSAKLPGARSHRFERSEVERVERDRGKSASSVGRALRQDGPELVGPFDLNAWAARHDAKTAFPELMDRLLNSTPGVTNVNIRSHEGTAAHGWDGTATSKGSSSLPDGELFFEFGTNADPKKKADEDYEKRAGKLSNPETGIFMFATPRNWPGAKQWASDKAKLGKYAGIEAFDSNRLYSWIREIPSVHHWISERLGYFPHYAQTLENWYLNFEDSLTIKLPSAFFTAGRSDAIGSILERLTSAGESRRVMTIQASNETEALAFIYGALGKIELLPSALVVHSLEAWNRLVVSSVPLILITTFEKPTIAKAIKNGHRVIVLASATDLIGAGAIKLPRIDPLEAGEAMNKSTKNFNEIRRLVTLARRRMPAFLREVSQDQSFSKPQWATEQKLAEPLARLILVSTWSNTENDHEVITRLVGKPWPDIERTLKALESKGHPVYIASGTSWQLGAPKEAAQLLLDQLVDADLTLWGDIVREVLLATDPYSGMGSSARLQAQFQGVLPKYSSELRHGIALSLALSAWSDVFVQFNPPLNSIVDQILGSIWHAASNDKSGALWGSLSNEMPLLAEAAPRVFLDAVEQDLDQDRPLLVQLFQDQTSDSPFGASSPHTGLLWALETLCWSPEYFGRAAETLARLTSLDPGGKLSNRPGQSFINVMLGWTHQSGATADKKLELLAFLTETMPETTWHLLIGLLPRSHGFSISPHTPTYQDWAAEPTAVLLYDWAHYNKGILTLVIGLASNNPSRWVQLVNKYDELPTEDRSELLRVLKEDATDSSWSVDEMHVLWKTLDENIRRHEEFSTSNWALNPDELANLRAMADLLASDSDPRRHIGLFEWRDHFEGMKYGDKGFDEALGSAQVAALTEVASQGIDALQSLALAVKDSQALGWQFATTPNAEKFDQQLIEWLKNPDPKLQGAGRAFVQTRISTKGWSWLESAYPIASQLDDHAMRLFASAIPFSHEYWAKLDESAPALVEAYWSREQVYLADGDDYIDAVDRLLAAKHPWAAIAVISNQMHRDRKPLLEVVKKTLSSLMSTSEPMANQSRSAHHVKKLLEFMEREVPDDPDLASYEFALFGLLHDKNPSIALYRALNESPQDFILMIRSLYRAEGEDKREATAEAKRFANRAWEILRGWKGVPGQHPDGTIDGEKLEDWVRVARFAFEESGHVSVGDEQIGEILSASPRGRDNIWPAEEVREIIEATGNVRLETGLQIGLFNRRGVTSRSPYEGGTQERALQEKYHQMSVTLAPKWRRTSRVLGAIAENFGREARREDDDAKRQADRE